MGQQATFVTAVDELPAPPAGLPKCPATCTYSTAPWVRRRLGAPSTVSRPLRQSQARTACPSCRLPRLRGQMVPAFNPSFLLLLQNGTYVQDKYGASGFQIPV